MIRFAENLNKMITSGLGGALEAPRTEVAVGHRVVYTEASGAVVNFETNLIAPIKKLRVTMEPIQEGTGDPSPDNVRPITGRDSVAVWREASYDPSTDPALTIQLGQTVYGGTLDVTTGEMVVDRAMVTLDGTATNVSYAPTSQGVKRYTIKIEGMKSGNRQPGYCNEFPVLTTTPGSGTYLNLGQGNAYVYIMDYDEVIGATSTAEFKTWLAQNQLQIVYPLAEPLTIQLSAEQLTTVLGQNNVWSDAGDVTLEYPYYEETEGY